ncbi:hypothetical protein [Mycolicibacterium aubagnense]|uniref:Transmembrane protein n=1 Tax=Mycolicibacterium aubagnense TaxID=319707 RepID=A0ABN5YU07_9MYCO|nr:hypothetical protein [Mycolicibacterium aubagnense]TLH50828.1 hypothetical protein C1S80_23995 [Mycolicibacterium aubagnense]WGI33757.1 hypothetical protein QDT91_05160 [Mycolicibacterium aubagnense]BBX84480.1 hypothetical protein MAUB_23530 [Mycolicibacterium aubagnense]
MHYLEAIFRVLVVGLIFGAGLPAVFAGGLVAYSTGAGGVGDDGTTHTPNAVLKALGVALFVLVGAIVLLAILWITKDVIAHHTGVKIFEPLGLK